jgi:hypothetical protein
VSVRRRELVEQTMLYRGLTAAETFERYTGWSNGYAQVVPNE